MARPELRCALLGAVVLMVKETAAALDVLPGVKAHEDSLGSPEQLYVTGSKVAEFATNPAELVTVRCTAVLVAPCATDSAPPVRSEVREKLLVTEVTAGAEVEILSEVSPL